MTEEQLREIEARAAAATQGPWFEQYEYDGGRTVAMIRSTDTTFCVNRAAHVDGNPCEQMLANGIFIAHAREDVPALVAEVRLLQEHIRGLKETLKRIHGRCVALAEITEVSE